MLFLARLGKIFYRGACVVAGLVLMAGVAASLHYGAWGFLALLAVPLSGMVWLLGRLVLWITAEPTGAAIARKCKISVLAVLGAVAVLAIIETQDYVRNHDRCAGLSEIEVVAMARREIAARGTLDHRFGGGDVEELEVVQLHVGGEAPRYHYMTFQKENDGFIRVVLSYRCGFHISYSEEFVPHI